MSRKVTVYQIAEKLGISVSTVSRVLNNSSLIGTEKSELIQKTAREMGYEKRNIKRPGSRAILNIVLFLPHSDQPQNLLFYDPSLLISGLKEGLSGTRVNIITELNDGGISVLDSKKIGDIDGAVFAFTDPYERMTQLLEDRGIPYLLLNRRSEKRNFISLDNRAAMDFLFDKAGESEQNLKPLYVGFKSASTVNTLRKEAFLNTCEAKSITGFAIREIESFGDISPDFIENLRNKGYNWLVCFNDIVAVSLMSSAEAAGIDIPGEMNLSGFDNSPIRNIFPKKISTIDLEVRGMGREAGRWFFRTIIEKEAEPIQLELPFKYIEGDTIRSRK